MHEHAVLHQDIRAILDDQARAPSLREKAAGHLDIRSAFHEDGTILGVADVVLDALELLEVQAVEPVVALVKKHEADFQPLPIDEDLFTGGRAEGDRLPLFP